MKYVVLLCDGMADYPVEELGGKTPMQAAHKPYMDPPVKKSQVGLVKMVAGHLKPGNDVVNLPVLGCSPAVYYTDRSSLKADSIGTNMKPMGVSSRCNLVALLDEPEYADRTTLDYYVGDISTEEAEVLIRYLAEHFDSEESRLYGGVSYRHCLTWDDGTLGVDILTPLHDITGKSIREYIPICPSAAKLYDMTVESYDLLKDHPVNRARVARGQRPTNSIWLWGGSVCAQSFPLEGKYGLKGSMISAIDLLKGIDGFSGMRVVYIENVTSYIDTNFEDETRAVLKELADGQDLVYIHVEVPDECGHRHKIENKIKSIEYIDGRILKLLLEDMEQYDDYNILVALDHPTPPALRTHTSDPVPFPIYRKSKECPGIDCFSEEPAATTGLHVDTGRLLMERSIRE